MKQSIFLVCLFTAVLLNSCSTKKDNPTPAASTGSASAKFNGKEWNSSFSGALSASFSGKESLTIVSTLTEKDVSENINIGLQPFTGVGTYTFDSSNKTALLFRVTYGGKIYSINQSGTNNGSVTVKITEYVASKGILNPGKVVGEFSGTIKNAVAADILTITNGKFTAIKAL